VQASLSIMDESLTCWFGLLVCSRRHGYFHLVCLLTTDWLTRGQDIRLGAANVTFPCLLVGRLAFLFSMRKSGSPAVRQSVIQPVLEPVSEPVSRQENCRMMD